MTWPHFDTTGIRTGDTGCQKESSIVEFDKDRHRHERLIHMSDNQLSPWKGTSWRSTEINFESKIYKGQAAIALIERPPSHTSIWTNLNASQHISQGYTSPHLNSGISISAIPPSAIHPQRANVLITTRPLTGAISHESKMRCVALLFGIIGSAVVFAHPQIAQPEAQQLGARQVSNTMMVVGDPVMQVPASKFAAK